MTAFCGFDTVHIDIDYANGDHVLCIKVYQ